MASPHLSPVPAHPPRIVPGRPSDEDPATTVAAATALAFQHAGRYVLGWLARPQGRVLMYAYDVAAGSRSMPSRSRPCNLAGMDVT
ncbi:MAG: hypothetical protein M1546_24345 [Chloroflexi bacterium]|nr:hypothetical protein [Chloroflexota bacterium]